ncbi:hypothetical protein ISCGN_000109 [Ixodes scapularis]
MENPNTDPPSKVLHAFPHKQLKPLDICEDPDLKERIVQLRSEMETKRAMQPNKLRRTQSQNTRSQSVRRTSIREKGMISRREAREEARIRQEQQAPVSKDEDEEASKKEATPEGDSSARTSPGTRSPGGSSTATEAVKVEIHVTVNTQQAALGFSPQNGTLSDLKKHRADLRNSRGSLTLSSSQQQELVGKMAASTGHNGHQQQHHFSATVRRPSYDPPPSSPSTSIRRFRSDPSEIVGEPQRKDCCMLM